MAVRRKSICLDSDSADNAAKIVRAKPRKEVAHAALSEIVALNRFKDLMKKNAGKLKFAAADEE